MTSTWPTDWHHGSWIVADAGGNDAKGLKGLHAPFQKLVAGLIPLELHFHVQAERIRRTICHYGPLPPLSDLDPDRLLSRLANDKKTLAGKVHFVLPIAIGEVKIVSGLEQTVIRKAIAETLQRAS